jgi:hypothetical protein
MRVIRTYVGRKKSMQPEDIANRPTPAQWAAGHRGKLLSNMMWGMMQDMIHSDCWVSSYGWHLIEKFEKCFPDFRKQQPGWIESLEEYLKCSPATHSEYDWDGLEQKLLAHLDSITREEFDQELKDAGIEGCPTIIDNNHCQLNSGVIVTCLDCPVKRHCSLGRELILKSHCQIVFHESDSCLGCPQVKECLT